MDRPVITCWETFSPFGQGADAHVRGLTGQDPPGTGLRQWVPDFDLREVLGRQGTRGMDRGAGLTVATTARLLDRVGLGGDRRTQYAAEEIGFVLGASDGVKSVMDFQRDTWTRVKPYDVNPADIPRTLMNFAAGKAAIWHQLKGPNSTICGSHTTGLLTLNYARRLYDNARARAVLWGAVEEYTPERASVELARYPVASAPGEGCVMFLLEGAGDAAEGGRTPLARILALDFGVYLEPDGLRGSLAGCLSRALDRAGLSPADVSVAAPSSLTSDRGRAECAAVDEVLGETTLLGRTSAAFGDTRAVSAAFQIVEVLLAVPPGAVAAVSSSDAEGRVGCALIRTC